MNQTEKSCTTGMTHWTIEGTRQDQEERLATGYAPKQSQAAERPIGRVGNVESIRVELTHRRCSPYTKTSCILK